MKLPLDIKNLSVMSVIFCFASHNLHIGMLEDIIQPIYGKTQ